MNFRSMSLHMHYVFCKDSVCIAYNHINRVEGREVLLQKFFPPLHKLSEQLPPPIIH